MARQTFSIQVAESVLDDLRLRLSLTSWPDEIPGSAWDYGTKSCVFTAASHVLAREL